MHHLTTDELHATQDVFEVFFDAESRGSVEAPEDVRAVLEPLVISTPA